MSASTDDIHVFPPAPIRSGPARVNRWPALQQAAQPVGGLCLSVVLGLILPLLLYALWSTAFERKWVAEQLLPSPAFVWETLLYVLDTGELLDHVKISAARVGWSLLVGGGAGLVLGFAMALSRNVKAYVFPTFNVLAQLPVLGWIPLLIIFVGIEDALKISAISIAVVVPVALSTMSGIENIPRSLLEVGRVYRFDAIQVITRIVLPAAAPSLFTGLRQGVMQAWLTVVFVELLSSSDGLGFMMSYSRSLMQMDMVITAMVAIAVVGLGIELVLRLIESRLQRWRRNAF